MMHIIRMLAIGLIVGILARFFYPGVIHMGLVMSTLLGIAGSFVAGFIGQFFQPAIARQPLHPAGFVYSVLGAMLLIYIARLLHLI